MVNEAVGSSYGSEVGKKSLRAQADVIDGCVQGTTNLLKRIKFNVI